MSLAFVPQLSRAIRGVGTFRSAQNVLPLRQRTIPTVLPASQRPRMQCTPTGEVPDFTSDMMRNMETKIRTALSPTRVQIVPTYGDPNGAHVSIEVISEKFEGVSPVKRHQAVYKAIWEELEVR